MGPPLRMTGSACAQADLKPAPETRPPRDFRRGEPTCSPGFAMEFSGTGAALTSSCCASDSAPTCHSAQAQRSRRIHSAGPAQNHGPCDCAQGDGGWGGRRVKAVAGNGVPYPSRRGRRSNSNHSSFRLSAAPHTPSFCASAAQSQNPQQRPGTKPWTLRRSLSCA